MQLKRNTFFLVVSILMISFLVGCGSGEKEDAPKSDDSATTDEELKNEDQDDANQADKNSDKAHETDRKGNTIEITATEMKFEPSQITLKKGQEYEFVMTNDGQVFHDFVEDEMEIKMTFMSDMPDHPDQTSMLDRLLGTKKAFAHSDEKHKKTLHMNAKPGQTVSIKFIPKETGEFEFYCSVPGHKEAGMKGTIIVEE
ncbi:cupredoxin domain-containing protein [Pseudalkalibacillus sp. Hm43]|uniref:cupredoxin domain-containing protein n=1 Tax=Pseudalkalibacillus sp. Hm43 TaxID=3450742 RepID=UPI003F437760